MRARSRRHKKSHFPTCGRDICTPRLCTAREKSRETKTHADSSPTRNYRSLRIIVPIPGEEDAVQAMFREPRPIAIVGSMPSFRKSRSHWLSENAYRKMRRTDSARFWCCALGSFLNIETEEKRKTNEPFDELEALEKRLTVVGIIPRFHDRDYAYRSPIDAARIG